MNAMLQSVGEQSPASFRDRLEAEIERLISLLDTLDGDPDQEADTADREPALGWVTLPSGRIVTGSDSDRELV